MTTTTTPDTKHWRFTRLPNALHQQAKRLAQTLTTTRQEFTPIESVMIEAVTLGLATLIAHYGPDAVPDQTILGDGNGAETTCSPSIPPPRPVPPPLPSYDDWDVAADDISDWR